MSQMCFNVFSNFLCGELSNESAWSKWYCSKAKILCLSNEFLDNTRNSRKADDKKSGPSSTFISDQK